MGIQKDIDIRQAALPAGLDPAAARLPAAYEAAKRALAECERIDECQTWADKMAALASYARQVEDDSLIKTAMRIHGRAVRRAGELLAEIPPAKNQHDAATRAGRAYVDALTCSGASRTDAARAAGLSDHQRVQALRVANVPADEFEAAIESDDPPTVTKLAEAGTKPRNPLGFDYLQGRDPQKFNAAIHTLAALKRFADKCAEHSPAFVAGGVGPHEVAEARMLVMHADAWLNTFFSELGGDEA